VKSAVKLKKYTLNDNSIIKWINIMIIMS